MAQYTKAAKDFAGFDGPVASDTVSGSKKGIDSYGLHLGTIVPVAGGDLTVGAYYLDGDTETLADSESWITRTSAFPLVTSTRSAKRTSLYAGAGYAEERPIERRNLGF